MKVGTENRTKLYIAIALFCVAVFFVYRWINMSSQASAQGPRPGATTAAPALRTPAPAPRTAGDRKGAPAMITDSIDPTLRTDMLKVSEDANYEGKGRNIFRAEAEPAPIPKVVKSPIVTPPPPTGPPPPPPINLKFYGFANNTGQGQKRVFLSQGEDIFVAGEGDVVKSRYKIIRINPTSIEVEDLLSNNRQSIPLTQG